MSKLLISSVAALCFSAPVADAMQTETVVHQRAKAASAPPSGTRRAPPSAPSSARARHGAEAHRTTPAVDPAAAAAATIQRAVRSHVARKEFAKLKDEREQEQALMREAALMRFRSRSLRCVGSSIVFCLFILVGVAIYSKVAGQPGKKPLQSEGVLAGKLKVIIMGVLALSAIILYYTFDGELGKGVEVEYVVEDGSTRCGTISSVNFEKETVQVKGTRGERGVGDGLMAWSDTVAMAALSLPNKTFLSYHGSKCCSWTSNAHIGRGQCCQTRMNVVRSGQPMHREKGLYSDFFTARNQRYLSYKIIYRVFGTTAEMFFNLFSGGDVDFPVKCIMKKINWKRSIFCVFVLGCLAVVLYFGMTDYMAAVAAEPELFEETDVEKYGDCFSLYGSLIISGVVLIGFFFALEIEKSWRCSMDPALSQPFGGVLLNLFGKVFMLFRMCIPVLAGGTDANLPTQIAAFVAGEIPLIVGNAALPLFAKLCSIDYAPKDRADLARHLVYLMSVDSLKTAFCLLANIYIFKGFGPISRGFNQGYFATLQKKLSGLHGGFLVLVGLSFHISLDFLQICTLNGGKLLTQVCCPPEDNGVLAVVVQAENGPEDNGVLAVVVQAEKKSKRFSSATGTAALVVGMEKWLLCGVIAPVFQHLIESENLDAPRALECLLKYVDDLEKMVLEGPKEETEMAAALTA